MNTLAPYIPTALIGRPGRLVYLSSGLHRGGEGSLEDLDWTARKWDAAKACRMLNVMRPYFDAII